MHHAYSIHTRFYMSRSPHTMFSICVSLARHSFTEFVFMFCAGHGILPLRLSTLACSFVVILKLIASEPDCLWVVVVERFPVRNPFEFFLFIHQVLNIA
jgi:hypothetical protein